MEKINKVTLDSFNHEEFRKIESMSKNEALILCLSIVDNTKTRASKRQALVRDLKAAPNSRELSRIMWNVLLAGEGLHTTNSSWQKAFNT